MDVTALQRSWDAQQETSLPDREDRFAAILDAVETIAGPAPRVLDLAGGTGSISLRLRARLPASRSLIVDADPVLLAIAEATFAGDDRVDVVRADLAFPDWLGAVAGVRCGRHRHRPALAGARAGGGPLRRGRRPAAAGRDLRQR